MNNNFGTIDAIKNAHAAGKTVAIVDMENAYDANEAAEYGANVGLLLVSQPDTDAQATDVLFALARAGVADIIMTFGVSCDILAQVNAAAKATNTMML